MADRTAVDDFQLVVPALPEGEAARGCAGPKIAAWVLAALVAVAAAGALASFIPRGRRKRGTRRLRRARPWHRSRTAGMADEDQGSPEDEQDVRP